MKYFVALFILISTCLHTKAQFHTIASRPLQYKVEIVKDRPKSETVNVKDSLAMVGKKEKSIDKEKWMERYMSVSLPLKRIKVTSPFGMRKDPFTGKRKMHNGIDLRARNDEVYAMFRKHPIKYPFSLLYFHCTFAFAILHELLTYFHYDTRTI